MTPAITRRDTLRLGTAAAMAAGLPAAAGASPAAVVWTAETVVAPILPAWAVGTPGEWDWQHIVARTEDEARRFYAAERSGQDECELGAPDDCDCEFCCSYQSAEAERKPAWDGKSETTAADWLKVGMGAHCSRCSYETSRDDCGQIIGDEAVCSECMTLADWDIVDPDRAAEIRAEEAEDTTPPPLPVLEGGL